MLAGRPAFTGSTAQSVITANITGPRPRIRAVRKAVPEAVERVLLKALDTDPAKRYGSVTEFAEALESASRAAAAGPDLRRWGALAALVVVVLGTAAWWLFGRGPQGPVVAEAERIAVMPFRATGPGAELLGEGMVDLLSTNLNGVGGVQTVEPRTVLQHIERKGGGTPDRSRRSESPATSKQGRCCSAASSRPGSVCGSPPISTPLTAAASPKRGWTDTPTACSRWWTGSASSSCGRSGARRSRSRPCTSGR
jgi:hypothetical protein